MLQSFQTFGGEGLIDEYPLTRILRNSKSEQIGGGTSEILCEILSKVIIDPKESNEFKKQVKKQTSNI